MSQTHYIESLLNLKDIIVTEVSQTESDLQITIQLERIAQPCPCCGTKTDTIHDYRTQPVKEVPILGKSTTLLLRKRRYRCPQCGKRFAEANSFLPRYQRRTGRLRQYIISRFSQLRSASSIAKECHCSSTTVFRLFQSVAFPRPHLPAVIAIDEFKGNAGGEKFQCILANPKKRKLLDILPSRKPESLLNYFQQFERADRNNVRYVVMDLSSLFRSVVRSVFPKAQIVADKFHVCRLVTWALERTRIRVQKQFHRDRRRYFKRSRWILLKRNQKLKPDELLQLENMLSLSAELRTAYLLKESFYKVMDSPDGATAKQRLATWNLYAQCVKVDEFESVVNTICEWSKEIVAAFETGLSNGFVEGMNNRTKVLKRTGYGMRNFERFRNRILYLDT